MVLQVLKHLQPDLPVCREKLHKVLQLINWPSFPGVQALVLKGLTSSLTAEPTWALLSTLTLCITAPIVDPSGGVQGRTARTSGARSTKKLGKF